MTLFDFFTEIIVPILVVAFSAFMIYGQFLLYNERYVYKRKHGVDPWRHGWDKDEKDEKQD